MGDYTGVATIELSDNERPKLKIFGTEIDQDANIQLSISLKNVLINLFFNELEDMDCECENGNAKIIFMSFPLEHTPAEIKEQFASDFEVIERIIHKIKFTIL